MIIIVKPGFLHLKDTILRTLDLNIDSESLTLILTTSQAELFYAEHKGKPFFDELIKYMTSGLCCFMKIDKDSQQIQSIRALIGNTSPSLAGKSTIRGLYGKSNLWNVVHCSDSHESALREEAFFLELCKMNR